MADARTPLLLDVFATWCVRGSVRERVGVRVRVKVRVRVGVRVRVIGEDED